MSTTFSSTPTWRCTPASGKEINSCAITPDGRRVACGTWVERGQTEAVYHVYCYDQSGTLLWSAPVSSQTIDHGVYWVSISDDGSTVAAGGEAASDEGFLCAWQYKPKPQGGSQLRQILKTSTSSRVNQVSLSGNGQCLVACYGSSVALFTRQSDADFKQLDHRDLGSPADVQSVMVDNAGTRAVMASRSYQPDGDTSGRLFSLDINTDGFGSTTGTTFDSGVMRVAITDDGSAWGGSLHDGSCVCFQPSSATHPAPAWRYYPESSVDIAYGFAISGSDNSVVQLALGANLKKNSQSASGTPAGGIVMSLTSTVVTHGQYTPRCNWSIPTHFGVNPGLSMDAAHVYTTATDGKPDDQHKVQESAGHFYLLNNQESQVVWSYKTKTMNWPMAIARDGSAIVGGSDDGQLLYWARND
jgi:hypothetical protein